MMCARAALMATLLALCPAIAWAQMDHSSHAKMDHGDHKAMDHEASKEMDHSDHGMILDREGMVMNHNSDRLPEDCEAISETVDFEVRVGTKYALTGLTFGYSQHQWRVKPCAQVNVTFINEDQVRHQWMVHGLPKYLYPQGMFHLEVNGGFQKTAAFIVPSGDGTLLVHCDISHHMEQGLKGQVLIGQGEYNIPGIPGLYAPRYPDTYP